MKGKHIKEDKMRYKLTVIVPVYNTAKYLRECVDSILEQTLKDIQVILVDDESPDDAGQICDDYAEKYSNIKVIHKENGGLGYARNSGIEKAEGEYIAFVDSDDYIEKDFYKRLIEIIEFESAEVCYSGGFYEFSENNKSIVKFYEGENFTFRGNDIIKKKIPRLISRRPDTNDLLMGSSCMAIYSTQFLKDNKLMFISERTFISEDVWFNMDCLEHANIITYANDIIGYNYRYNDGSLSRGYNPERFNILYSSIEKLIQRCREEKFEDYFGRVALYFWVNYEKCINQEIRFNNNNPIKNIKVMNKKIYTREFLKYLSKYKLNGMLHTYLCHLLYRERYRTLYIMLKLYNSFR